MRPFLQSCYAVIPWAPMYTVHGPWPGTRRVQMNAADRYAVTGRNYASAISGACPPAHPAEAARQVRQARRRSPRCRALLLRSPRPQAIYSPPRPRGTPGIDRPTKPHAVRLQCKVCLRAGDATRLRARHAAPAGQTSPGARDRRQSERAPHSADRGERTRPCRSGRPAQEAAAAEALRRDHRLAQGRPDTACHRRARRHAA